MNSKQRKYFKRRPSTISDESSSSEDDQNGELLTEELEKDFLKVLSHLKKKDPKLYTENLRFFHNEQNTSTNSVKVEENQEEEEITQWLKGQKASVEVGEKEELEALHDFWSNPNLDEKEQFLRDYLLDKTFLKRDDEFDPSKEMEKLEEEEKEVEEQLVFEEKFNYRFENCDEEFLKNYPRTMKKICGRKSDTSEQEESSEEDETVLESNKEKMNNEYGQKESFESSSESEDGVEITKNTDIVVNKHRGHTVANVKEPPRKLKKILNHERKVNQFEIISSTTHPNQVIINNNHSRRPSYKARSKRKNLPKTRGNKENGPCQSGVKPQGNGNETNDKLSKLKRLSNDIEHLKGLISQSPNICPKLRLSNKLRKFLKNRRRSTSYFQNKKTPSLRAQLRNMKRKKKHRAKLVKK